MKKILLFLFFILMSIGSAFGVTPGSGYSLVTNISSLSTGDYVILFCNQNGEGVSGYNGNKDATVSTTSSNWKRYYVTKSANSFTLKDETANKFIASPIGNEFKYGTTGGDCTVKSDGLLTCNSRNLKKNSSNYRFYTQTYTNMFYVYKVITAYTITTQSNNTNYGTVSLTGTTITATPNDGYRISTSTPYTVTSGTATVTDNGDGTFSVTPTSNCTITINFETIPTYTVSFVNNHGDNPNPITGSTITLPTVSPSATCISFGWEFAGWSTTNDLTTTNDLLTGSYTPTGNITLYAVFRNGSDVVTDTLTQSLIGISGTTYTYFSDINVISSAIYAGQCSGDNSAIQIRSKNSNSGVISTTSGGNLSNVTVVWESHTQNGRVLNIYGKNTAYTSATDLFDNDLKGTLLGTITCGTSTTLDITGNYTFIGCCSSDGAMYLSEIRITWGSGSAKYSLNPTCVIIEPESITLNKETTSLNGGLSETLVATVLPAGASQYVTWTSSNDDIVTIDENGKITAISEGVATITATTVNDLSATCVVTVLGKASIDIAKWDTNAVYIDVDNFVGATAVLENQNTQAIIKQKEAKDLFFAKYFEGEGTVKMISIYNGTGHDVDLSKYQIILHHYDTANVHKESNNKTIDFLSIDTINSIKNGQEIIFYATQTSAGDIQDCSNEFFSEVGTQYNENDNPRWIKDNTNIVFNGNDALLLINDGDTIDIFGSIDGPVHRNCRKERSWFGSILNMDYKKTEADFTSDVWGNLSDYGINITDSIIDVYSARCVLYRSKHVLTGDSAVKYNKTDFNTFTPDEWYGRNICKTGTVSGLLTCNSYSDLGTFNYEEYYAQYDTIVSNISLPDSLQDDGTYKITIPQLDTLSCTNLKIIVKDNANHELSQTFKIPIMVAEDINTKSELFRKEKTDCPTCDVVIMHNAKLTVDSTMTNRNLKVYEGSILDINSELTYTLTSLSLRKTDDTNPYLTLKGNISLAGDSSFYLDIYTDPSEWRWLVLPDTFDIRNITLSNGKHVNFNEDYLIKTYSGYIRATQQKNGWADVTSNKVFMPGEGFIFGIAGEGTIKKEFRFKFANNILTKEKVDKTLDWSSLQSWGCDDPELRPNHKGWNLVGNAFLDKLSTEVYNPIGIGKLVHTNTDPWDGKWDVETGTTGNLRYRVIHERNSAGEDGNGYSSELLDDVQLEPFSTFFIQLGGNEETRRTILLKTENRRKNMMRRMIETVDEDDELFLRVFVDNKKTGMFISNKFTEDYEPGDDLESRQTIYQSIGGYNLLYSAVPDSTLIKGITVHSAGGHLILDPKVKRDKFEYIYAKVGDNWIDLLLDEADVEEGDFILYAKRKENNVATDTEMIIPDANGNLYDVLGRRVGKDYNGVVIKDKRKFIVR